MAVFVPERTVVAKKMLLITLARFHKKHHQKSKTPSRKNIYKYFNFINFIFDEKIHPYDCDRPINRPNAFCRCRVDKEIPQPKD